MVMSLSLNGIIDIVGACLTLVPVICYFYILRTQYNMRKEGTLRLQVLNCRAVIGVPIYAVFVFISLIFPQGYNAFNIPIAAFEGYSFYCFFSLVVTNLGGPSETVRYIQDANNPICCTKLFCSSCCPTDSARFYARVLSALFHFVTTRMVVVCLSVIIFYALPTTAGKLIFVVLQLVSFVILVNGVLSVVNFYENVMDANSNIYGVLKFLVLKISVGLIVVQGLIVDIIIALNKVTLQPDDTYSPNDRALRVYLFLVLLEYLFISLVMTIAFSKEMLPSIRKRSSSGFSPVDNPKAFDLADITFHEFFMKVIRFQDVFGVLTFPQPVNVPLSVKAVPVSNYV